MLPKCATLPPRDTPILISKHGKAAGLHAAAKELKQEEYIAASIFMRDAAVTKKLFLPAEKVTETLKMLLIFCEGPLGV